MSIATGQKLIFTLCTPLIAIQCCDQVGAFVYEIMTRVVGRKKQKTEHCKCSYVEYIELCCLGIFRKKGRGGCRFFTCAKVQSKSEVIVQKSLYRFRFF